MAALYSTAALKIIFLFLSFSTFIMNFAVFIMFEIKSAS